MPPVIKSLQGIKKLNVGDIQNKKSLKFTISGATPTVYSEILNRIKSSGYSDRCSVNYAGPSYSKMFWRKSVLASFLGFGLVATYLAMRYSAQLAIGGSLALLHDCFSALLAIALFRVSFDMTTLIAILTIFGYSVNNTIVIFDEISRHPAFLSGGAITVETRVGLVESVVRHVFGRVVMTTATTLVPVVAMFIFAGYRSLSFSVPMLFGLLSGAASSIVIAPSFYVCYGPQKSGELYAR